MKKALYIALIVFLTSGTWSCSAKWHLRKAISKDPGLMKETHIVVYDTLVTERVQADTSFYFYQIDTVVLKQDRLTMKYFFNHDSTVYLSGECEADTVIREITVQAPPQVVYKDSKPDIWFTLAFVFVCAIALWGLFRRRE
jgi:hypothetical protein